MEEDKCGDLNTDQSHKSPFAFVGVDVKAESWEEIRADAVAVLGLLDQSYQDYIDKSLHTKLVMRIVAIAIFLPAPMIN